MDDILACKKAVRERLLAERASLGRKERTEKSAVIRTRLESIAEYANAGSILFYMTIVGEADVTPLILDALRQRKLCALPKCGPDCSLKLFSVASLERDVAPGMLGIPEPAGDAVYECFPEDLSVIVVPGVAYDRQGHRLGRGAGYYDRLLGDCGKNVLKIAPAYAFQVLHDLPCEPHDAPVDIIVTEEEIIDCREERRGYHG